MDSFGFFGYSLLLCVVLYVGGVGIALTRSGGGRRLFEISINTGSEGESEEFDQLVQGRGVLSPTKNW